jgi:hypothetical protein
MHRTCPVAHRFKHQSNLQAMVDNDLFFEWLADVAALDLSSATTEPVR